MTTLTANLEIFSTIAVLGLALLLAVVSLLSWRRLRHPRALFIGLGFVVLAIQGAFLVQQSMRLKGSEDWLVVVALLDLLALVLLYLAIRTP